MKKEKIHLLEVNKFYYPPHVGGIETVCRQHSEYFSSLEDFDCLTLVCAEKGRGKRELIKGARVVRADTIGTYFSCPLSFDFISKLGSFSKKADILELHVPFPLGDAAVLLSGFRGKVVVYWHSDIIKQKKFLFFYKPVIKKILKRADLILVATENHISSSSYLPAFADKCRVVPYGIDPKDYPQMKERLLSERLTDKKAVKIFFTGRLVYYKGVDILLKAYIESGIENAELFISGEGILREELEKMAAGSGKKSKIHFLGKLSDRELKAAYGDCDFFVMPSVANSEAFGIVQLEAMIYGKPVINTSLPTGVPCVSLHEKTGLTVSPASVKELGEAMRRLCENAAERETFGRAAKKRVLDNFSLEVSNKRVYDLFCDIVKERGR